jgi:hypothetical protein
MTITSTCEQCKIQFSYYAKPSQHSRRRFCNDCIEKRKKWFNIMHEPIGGKVKKITDSKSLLGWDYPSTIL